MKNYGEILKEHRLVRGLTLKDIELKTGINNGSLSRWERNEVLPSIESCVQLANFYGIKLDELLGIEEGFDDSAIVPLPSAPASDPDDQKLLDVYHMLDDDMKATLWALLNTWTPTTTTLGNKKLHSK